ncbi:MAG: glycosyltransferase family 2 protein [Gemmatimonadota bacterium]|nr:glycosyltransferase family 2 protein [Gemmatimonadota bacterium]
MRAETVFWLAVAVAAYVYAGYPLLLAGLRLAIRRPVRKAPIEPSVSLLVAAYNEADVIEAKIRNALALDYPADRLEIVIASDGSTDQTAEFAQRLADGERVRVFVHPTNRGKLAVLNEAVPLLRGEVVAFSDASSMLARDSLRRLVESFADATVGAVSGVYRVRRHDEAQLGRQEDFYWRYETFLKKQEAALDSVLGAHGSLYAIRKSLYPFPRPGAINDDYIIPVRVLGQGYRVAYEPGAVAEEAAREMGGFSRRVRIMTGNVQQLRELGTLLRPPRWLALLFFVSHKAGRLVVPLAMIAMAVANVFLLEFRFYQSTLLAQIAFYALVLLGAVWEIRPQVLRLPYYFCMINAAAFLGMYHALRGRRSLAWKRE